MTSRTMHTPTAEIIPHVRLDAVVRELNEMQRTAALEYSLRVGRLIVTEIFQSDLSQWRLHRHHHVSFRQLAARTQVDLKLSVTSLYRAVALYDLCSRVPVELWRDLGAAHLRAVLGLGEGEQLKLLSVAKAKGWTARQLHAAARPPARTDAKPRPAAHPLARLLRRLITDLKNVPLPDDQREAAPVTALATELREVVDRLHGHLTRVAALRPLERASDTSHCSRTAPAPLPPLPRPRPLSRALPLDSAAPPASSASVRR